MKCRKKEAPRGSSLVEFVLVLPWLVGSVLAVIVVTKWLVTGQVLQYAAFKGARAISVYEEEGALLEMRKLASNIEIVGLEEKELYLGFWADPLHKKMITHAPIHFSLEGITLNLSNQSNLDQQFHQPLMDNWIHFCGDKGHYALCEN